MKLGIDIHFNVKLATSFISKWLKDAPKRYKNVSKRKAAASSDKDDTDVRDGDSE